MKDKTKKILEDLVNITGYSFSIGWIITLYYIFHKIYKQGQVIAIEPNQYILGFERIGTITSAGFLGYKLVKGFYDKYKLK